MNENRVKLSVIMLAFNSEKYIGQAIRSILNQTFHDLELIIVNDGSTDRTGEIISSFSDPRIKVFNNLENKGIVYSRNLGMKNVRGEYLTMFDSDDIALPDKFRKQIEFMDAHPEYGAIGSWVYLIDEEGKRINNSWKLTKNPGRTAAAMLFRNYFVNSATIIRKTMIPSGMIPGNLNMVEDYFLFFEIGLRSRIWNLQEYLVEYRIHPESITQKNRDELIEMDKVLFGYIFSILDIPFSHEDLNVHLMLKYEEKITCQKELKMIRKWLEKIRLSNRKNRRYNKYHLNMEIWNRWIKACFMARKFPASIIRESFFLLLH